jgi:hypothetical protein
LGEELAVNTVLVVDANACLGAAAAENLHTHCAELPVLLEREPCLAMQTIMRHRVSLVLMVPHPQRLDGFQFLAHLMSRNPKVAVVVMSPRASREAPVHLSPLKIPPLVTSQEGPVLAALVRRYLEPRQPGQDLGVTLLGLLQTLHQEQVTCTLEVVSGRRRGRVGFHVGELIHAQCRRAEGNEAVIKVLSWPDPRVLVLAQPRDQRQTTTLRTGSLLGLLCSEGTQGNPEQAQAAQQKPALRIHAPPPNRAAFETAWRARSWTRHANHRLSWWEQKPFSKWVEPEDDEPEGS